MAESDAPARCPPSATCPRCGQAFCCGANDDAPCACTTVTLSATALRDLRERFEGCLCLRCLQAIAAGEER